MDRKRMEKMLERYEAKAERAYRSYQDSGIYHYEWQYRNAEEMADIIRIGLNAADEHTSYISLRSDLANLAAKAERAVHDIDSILSVINNIVSLAESYGVYRRRHEL